MKARELIKHAWDEWRVNGSYAGVSPDLFEIKPTKWFTSCELGHGRCDCERCQNDHASLLATCNTLKEKNVEAIALLGIDAPKRVTYPKRLGRRPRARKALVNGKSSTGSLRGG